MIDLTTFPGVWLLVAAISFVLGAWCALVVFVIARIASRLAS